MRIILDSLMITGFVAAMMLLIEYVNVLSGGQWSQRLARGRFGQYLLAALLGVAPGCLGSFTVVALYSHGAVSFGAVVATMIATSGDEAFVMLALIPKTALVLTAILFALSILSGIAVDLIAGRRFRPSPECPALVVHPNETVRRWSAAQVIEQWKNCTAARGVLTTVLLLFSGAIAAGQLGPPEWNWIRVSLLLVSLGSLYVAAVVPDHFVEEHLWRHVARKHVPRVFLWTLAALAASGPLERVLRIGDSGFHSQWLLLVVACAIGLIPESGPHLVFVTLYAEHAIPFGVLLASSIVQDGHGMLPMLAHSRRAFLAVKAVNFAIGFGVGAVALSFQ